MLLPEEPVLLPEEPVLLPEEPVLLPEEPVLLLTVPLWALLFQPGDVMPLVRPRLLSALTGASFMYACLLFCLLQQLQPLRKTLTPSKPIAPAKGILPIGLSSPRVKSVHTTPQPLRGRCFGRRPCASCVR